MLVRWWQELKSLLVAETILSGAREPTTSVVCPLLARQKVLLGCPPLALLYLELVPQSHRQEVTHGPLFLPSLTWKIQKP